MDNDRCRRLRITSHENEPPASIGWYSDDCPNSDFLASELVLSPIQTFIGAKQNVIRRYFIIDDDKDGSRIAKLPEMCVFVNFFPGKAQGTAEESVALFVGSKFLADISDSHQNSDN